MKRLFFAVAAVLCMAGFAPACGLNGSAFIAAAVYQPQVQVLPAVDPCYSAAVVVPQVQFAAVQYTAVYPSFSAFAVAPSYGFSSAFVGGYNGFGVNAVGFHRSAFVNVNAFAGRNSFANVNINAAVGGGGRFVNNTVVRHGIFGGTTIRSRTVVR